MKTLTASQPQSKSDQESTINTVSDKDKKFSHPKNELCIKNDEAIIISRQKLLEIIEHLREAQAILKGEGDG